MFIIDKYSDLFYFIDWYEKWMGRSKPIVIIIFNNGFIFMYEFLLDFYMRCVNITLSVTYGKDFKS